MAEVYGSTGVLSETFCGIQEMSDLVSGLGQQGLACPTAAPDPVPLPGCGTGLLPISIPSPQPALLPSSMFQLLPSAVWGPAVIYWSQPPGLTSGWFCTPAAGL